MFVLAAITAIGLLWSDSAQADHETHVYGIAEYGESGQCRKVSAHSEHTDTAAEFLEIFEELKDEGDWDSTITRNNDAARGSFWTDKSKESTCKCQSYQDDCWCTGHDTDSNFGADEADVVFIHTHGGSGYKTDGKKADYTKLYMGNIKNDCEVSTKNNMLWGGDSAGDLDIAVVKACQSAQYEVFVNGGFWSMIDSDSTFRMWNGFHGDSSCWWGTSGWIGDYAEDSVWEGVGENWVDEAYDDWGDDDCPVSIVFCNSESKCDTMYAHGGWLDRKDTGAKTLSKAYFIGGCNPDPGQTLPEEN
ncbi:MAG: hypothetical protein HYV63_20090 [Candidatus Schekmanbacteria bacterium]|nr:hypothetical protein [Candidatus Schekmanbacteria bacterium]